VRDFSLYLRCSIDHEAIVAIVKLAMAKSIVAPRPGVSYPIVLGESLLSGNTDVDYVIVSSNFQPSAVSRARTGLLCFQPNGSDNSAKVRRASLRLSDARHFNPVVFIC
jgi:hypothetical protein